MLRYKNLLNLLKKDEGLIQAKYELTMWVVGSYFAVWGLVGRISM